jgi:hypothetical protein
VLYKRIMSKKNDKPKSKIYRGLEKQPPNILGAIFGIQIGFQDIEPNSCIMKALFPMYVQEWYSD